MGFKCTWNERSGTFRYKPIECEFEGNFKKEDGKFYSCSINNMWKEVKEGEYLRCDQEQVGDRVVIDERGLPLYCLYTNQWGCSAARGWGLGEFVGYDVITGEMNDYVCNETTHEYEIDQPYVPRGADTDGEH